MATIRGPLTTAKELSSAVPHLKLLKSKHNLDQKEGDTTNSASPQRSPSASPAGSTMHDDAIIMVDGLWAPNLKQDRVECPHCHRRFGEEAANRHITKCATIKAKPNPPPKDNTKWYTDSLGRRAVGAPTPQKSEPSRDRQDKDKLRDQYEQVHILLKDQKALASRGKIEELVDQSVSLLAFMKEVGVQATEQGVRKSQLMRSFISDEGDGRMPTLAKTLRDLFRLKILDDTDIELCTTSLMLMLAFAHNLINLGEDDMMAHLADFQKASA